MKVTKTTELLERWAELEPEMCEYDEEMLVYILYCTSVERVEIVFEYDYAAPFLIQGAAQEAIEARGWQWELHGSRAYHSAVVKSIDISMKIKDADTPADALLAAYLEALETTKTEGVK